MPSPSFLKKAVYLGSGLLVKLFAGLLAVRVSAQVLGPENFGLTGQIAGLISVVTLLAAGGLANGVSKIYAGSEVTDEDRESWLQSAGALAFSFFSAVALFLLAFTPLINELILKNHEGSSLITLSMVFFAGLVAISAVPQGKINGSHRDDLYALSMIAGSIAGVAGLFFFIWCLGKTGIFIGIVWLPAAQYFMIYLIGAKFDRNTNFSFSIPKLNQKSKFFLRYGALSATTGLIIPIAYIYLRSVVDQARTAEYLGLWQANIRISEAYLQLPMMMLTVVLFAKFASQAAKPIQISQIGLVYAKISALLLIIFIPVYFLRDWWIPIVFNDDFKKMAENLPIQLLGDFFRVNSYIGTTLLAARGFIRIPIACEIFQGVLLVVLGTSFIYLKLSHDIYLAYATTYFMYLSITAALVFWAAKTQNSH